MQLMDLRAHAARAPRHLAIACGDGRLLRVLELQGEGGKRMAAADYLRGHPVPLGL